MSIFTLVETTVALKKMCDYLVHNATEIALDVEADSMHHYREKVCLVQVSTVDRTWIVDPLDLTDISDLSALLADPAKTIVMHGADYDVRLLYRDYGIEITTLFDTMIAAQFLGREEFGLAALSRDFMGIILDKKFQKADWSKRPISDEMLLYAANDTAHLLQLATNLRTLLQEKKRLEWAVEESMLLAENRMADKSNGPLFIHFKGAGKLSRRSLAVLEELLQLRDSVARVQDRPPFKIMPPEVLVSLSEKKPRIMEELQGIAGLTPRLIERYGSSLLAAVKRGTLLPEVELPIFPRVHHKLLSAQTRLQIAALKSWREAKSAELHLAPGFFAPNWLLELVAERLPDSQESLASIPGIRRWQISAWNNEPLEILRNILKNTGG